MKQLEAGELPLRKIFCSDFDFEVPEYQRPYAWETEQALQLLDDLEDSLDSNRDEPYFLGSIVLVKGKGDPLSKVIDGQQRLTTLTLLFAILRDVTVNEQLAGELCDLVEEPGRIMAGTKPKPRLRLRSRDADFFEKYVQTPGNTGTLAELDDSQLKDDAQRALRSNARELSRRMKGWSEEKRSELASTCGQRTYLVVVSTPDLESAHRIFSVMNARGLELTPADIFKARVIGEIGGDDGPAYAEKWEDAEQDLGRPLFADLFLHIRMIFAKERAKRELLKEFETQVLDQYLPQRARDFVDDILIPYSEACEQIVNLEYSAGPGSSDVNTWLKRLNQLDNNDWRPPALWAIRHHGNDPAYVADFLTRLERLAASMLIRRVYATPRALRYAELLRQLDSGAELAAAFELTTEEIADTRRRLQGEIYLVQAVRKYVLLRLDELLAKAPGVTYDHRVITVEHVLPQQPAATSRWARDFTDDQRAYWLNRIANLVLLNRAKNSEAQNFEFDTKKSKYFTGRLGVSAFALTSQVLNTPTWTPAVLEARQQEICRLLFHEWNLP